MKKQKKKFADFEERTRRDFHRTAYHRHFEGYSEFEVIDKNGVSHIQRVYTGMYYSHPLARKKRVVLKLFLIVLWIVAVSLFLFGAIQPDVGNTHWYVCACQVGDVIGLAWTCFGLFNYLTVPTKMTVGDWRSSSQKLKHGSLFAAIFLWATSFMILIDLVISATEFQMHLLCAMCFLLSGMCMITEWVLENRIVYIQTASQEYAPSFAARIR